MKRSFVFALSFIALIISPFPVMAEILFTGGTYTQNFDTLPQVANATRVGRGPHSLNSAFSVSGLDGWYGANPTGSSGNTEFRAHDGSQSGNAGRGVVSFGSAGSGERALGALPTGNQISSFGAVFTNATGSDLVSITISFTGEQWRAGQLDDPNVQNTLSFNYGFGSSIGDANISVSSLDFDSPNLNGGNQALNGNDPSNQTFRTATISGLNWQNGSALAIRWNINELGGQDNGLAIDDFSFSASAVPEPSTMALLGLVSAGAFGFRRLRKSVGVFVK